MQNEKQIINFFYEHKKQMFQFLKQQSFAIARGCGSAILGKLIPSQ